MKKAAIRSAHKHSPFGLQVSQPSPSNYVYFDKVDRASHAFVENHLVIAVKPGSARKLAQWILDNVEE